MGTPASVSVEVDRTTRAATLGKQGRMTYQVIQFTF
jgi:hypothetical protein